ncbi:SDR family NAD(P)-dependent oxidoreductase [Serinibacter salmoneus]|uniref:NADP-dependent 3-hydroxy acid dehydrogenase YdfG n=1 Tax=Serinibacter salmoneus TaxID=556530 RepID=A0A2A9CZZ8_9MICO|nr:SDR family oxidoreductase [Serinibacter salmoneus]PFG19272.1 NADP-dependent 3-hydroxy acid dehydrogenase YdfG [Serinibacter salmoneus]
MTIPSPETIPPRAVVTGASTGIGAATVRLLRRQGWDVVATARRADRLEALAQETGCHWVAADLTVSDDVARLGEEVAAGGGLTALVNNAGGALGQDPVASGRIEDWQTMYERNVLAALRTTQTFLPLLEADGGGDVLFVTSTAAHGAYPGGAGYTGVKRAEREIALTMRQELIGRPVRILEFAPGLVETEEFSLNRFGGDAERAAAVYAGMHALSAEDVAEGIVWTLSRPRHVNIDLMIMRPLAQATNTAVARTQG